MPLPWAEFHCTTVFSRSALLRADTVTTYCAALCAPWNVALVEVPVFRVVDRPGPSMLTT